MANIGIGPQPPSDDRVQLTAVTDELNLAVQEYVTKPQGSQTDVDNSQRRHIIDAAHKILNAVQDPADSWVDMTANAAMYTATRLFCDWKVFDAIPLEGSVSYAELGEKTETEESLLRRVGGVLVSMGVLKQIGTSEVAHTPRSRIYKQGDASGLVFQMTWENGLVPYAQFPAYFAQYGRKEPQTINHVPGTTAYGCPEFGFYEMLTHDPPRMQRFLTAMAAVEERMPIAGVYDFTWLVEKARDKSNSERAVFVDVGGGKGQAIKAIHAEFPGLPLTGCVLQDRPEVIEAGAALDDAHMWPIQRMASDFHKEQPVKGALVYWIRRCLHNYGDEISAKMLRILADAMADDSRILIQEDVLDNPPNFMASMLDFMMIAFGGKQRNLETWEGLVGAAGLRISSISRGRGPWKTLAVIECVKK